MSESRFLENLNTEQRLGVTTTEGPVLILAGAGSGKTRVLTNRVAYLISECGVAPYNIMAITFTNKAAKEMRERIDTMVGFGSDSIWVSTFHSSCVRILRRYIEFLGYGTNFSIYDTDDSKQMMKDVCKYMEIDTKRFKEKYFLNEISNAKNELIGPEEYLLNAGNDYNRIRIGQVYREYQARLKANNALDFDDIIMKTVELLKGNAEVLNFYHEKFQYVMVDEYQDTNTAQLELVRLLSGGRRNLCVVGDDDQSIYKFRGANIYNILNFERYFPEATVIKLEQNYRSTQVILDAANGVIANNKGRKDKALWTENDKGEKISFKQFDSAYEEADHVVRDLCKCKRNGIYNFGDSAILYRTNAQSRILEEKLIEEGVPYKIIGGVNFYSRMEIKDIIAYLKVIDNPVDEIAIRRIINVPKRGIGGTTLLKVSNYALDQGLGFYAALSNAAMIPSIGKASEKLLKFVSFIEEMRDASLKMTVPELITKIITDTGYVEQLEAENTDEAKARIENIDELLSKAVAYQTDAEVPSLSGFLEEVSLIADIDTLDENADYVVLMTLHSAKGLEFMNVYMVGMEEGLFPSYMTIAAGEDTDDLEEERRLCYVGITRAMEKLTMTSAKKRMIRGEIQFNAISRFVKEIPEHLLDGNTWEPKPRDSFLFDSGSATRNDNPFMKMKPSAMSTPINATPRTTPKNFGTTIEKKELEYSVGDRVNHVKFGEGTVTLINDGGRDFEVTVEFDRVGVKKMFASFAKLKKI